MLYLKERNACELMKDKNCCARNVTWDESRVVNNFGSKFGGTYEIQSVSVSEGLSH